MIYDYDETIELLQRAVAEKGDGHKAQCQYRDYDPQTREKGQPICIVGHVLSYIDLLDQVMEASRITGQRVELMNQFTPAALKVLELAQWEQDSGKTWGEALIAAKGIEL